MKKSKDPGHKGAHLITKESAAKALAARKARRQERGAPYGAIVALAVMEEIAKRTGQRVFTPRDADIPAQYMRNLCDAGYLERRSRGLYTLARSYDYAKLPSARRKQIIARITELPPPLAAASGAPTIEPPARFPVVSETKLIRQALKALGPFARYGARVEGADPAGVPTLLRKDGLTYGDFQAAHEARKGLLSVLGGDEYAAQSNDAAPAQEDEEVERYFRM